MAKTVQFKGDTTTQHSTFTGVNRETIIAAATANDEPSVVSFASPFIFEVQSGDYFEFYIKAMENGNNPLDTRLSLMQLTTHKIHNL